MLEAISDFWKPMKKAQAQEKIDPEQLQLGSSIGFGFVPQASLNGRRVQIIGINTYKFGEETLTSFVLGQDKDTAASMIVAESEGEHYLAISRRITISDRMKMFDSRDLENIMDKPDVTQLPCKDNLSDFKGWTVPAYKREIQGMTGAIYKGDYRKSPLPASSESQPFTYTLLVSETNEHAIEIEKYADGRVEMYATVYRRMGDIGEIIHPSRGTLDRPDIKMASTPAPEVKPAAAPEAAKPAETPPFKKPAPIALQEFSADTKPTTNVYQKEEKSPMATVESAVNGAAKSEPRFIPNADAPKVNNAVVHSTAPESFLKQEVKTVSKTINGMENEAIECDLRVANKIIDEAIRNEMRLSDIVRRIIELPVAYPEAVQIPITLSDEDFALLAIRYGIAASDRNAIKRRIMEDLNDFSGASQQKKAA